MNSQQQCTRRARPLLLNATPIALLTCLQLTIATNAFGEPGQADQSVPVTPRVESLSVLNKPQEAISEGVVRTANWIDGFFGSDRSYQESQGSYLKASLAYTHEDYSGSAYNFNVRGNLNLPRTEDRIKLILESDPDEEDHLRLTDTLQDQQQTLGFRYTHVDNDQWRFHADTGVRFRSGLDFYVRARVRRQFPGEIWNRRLSQSVANYESTGLEAASALDFERELDARHFLRAASIATWTEQTRYYEWKQALSLFRNINRFSVLRYQIGTRSISEPSLHAVEHYVSIHYRRQLHRDWLFLEITPRLAFPKEQEFARVKSIIIQFDAIVGEPRRD